MPTAFSAVERNATKFSTLLGKAFPESIRPFLPSFYVLSLHQVTQPGGNEALLKHHSLSSPQASCSPGFVPSVTEQIGSKVSLIHISFWDGI